MNDMIESESTDNSSTVSSTSFQDMLPEELASESSLKDFKDITSLAKSYVNAQRMIGGSIRIPGEDAGEEQLNEFYSKLESVPGVMRKPNMEDEHAINSIYHQLGKPDKVDGYTIDIPEQLEIDAEKAQIFKEKAHQLNLTQAQLQGVLDIDNQRQLEEIDSANTAKEEAIATLKTLWGPEYDARIDSARKMVSVYKEKYPDIEDLMSDVKFGNSPAFMVMLSELANSYQQSGKLVGQGKVQFGVSSEEALEKISEIKANREHPYWKGDADAKIRMEKLYNIAYPE